MRWLAALVLLILCASLAVEPSIKPLPADDLCLAWVIQDEARGESLQGQKAVLDVVTKRMQVRKLSACGVIRQPYQFSGYRPGMTFELNKNVKEKDLTRLYELRKMSPVVEQATYFHAEYVRPSWKTDMKRLSKIGKHVFYKPKEKTK